ncbi:MAG: glutamine-hydrolyzing GMP synthase, partial [Spirochaetales bacterium]|nr:glutamine-hydrolyzing GMP synthase [Spirochaetales bacterium]
MEKNHDTVIVLDFGAQYSQLIARRVRELGVYSQIVPFNTSAEEIKKMAPKGIIFSGGPASVSQALSPRPDKEIFNLNIPILGICYGLQVMSLLLGGHVTCPEKKEYGIANINIIKASKLLKDVSNLSQVWMSHGDSVDKIPEGFSTTANTPNCPYTVIEDEKRNFYGVQFHPEVVHSVEGQKMLSNFVLDICKAKADWNMGNFINEAVESIRKEVGDGQVLCGLSGGVDS